MNHLKNTTTIFLVIGLLSIVSCKRDDDVVVDDKKPDIIEPNAAEYFPLKVGNYWVYRNFTIMPNGERITKRRDTLKISDIKIEGKDTSYFIENQADYLYLPNGWVRDSAGCLVAENGFLYYSINNFTDTLYVYKEEPFLTLRGYMEKIDSGYSAKTQVFNDVINFKIKAWMPIKYRNEQTKDMYPRYAHNFYAKNFGLLYAQFFVIGAPTTFTIELESYNLVP